MADSLLHLAAHHAAETVRHAVPPHTSGRIPGREATLFGDAGPDEVADLLGHGVTLDVSRGETVYAAGAPATDLYLVRAGKVKLVTDTRHRGERILGVALGPSAWSGQAGTGVPPRWRYGDHFGHDGVSSIRRYRTSAVVVADARLLRIPSTAVSRWVQAEADRATNLARLLDADVQHLHSTLADLAELDTAARLAKQLLQFARRLNAPSHGPALVQHDLTQAELAQLVGSSRETVCKVLSEFSRRGWLQVDNRSVTILDHGRLLARSAQT